MSTKYTAEWIEERVREKDAKWLDHHNCSLCGFMVGYHVGGRVAFNPGCGCSDSGPRPSSYREIADWLAMQSSDEIRDKIMAGLH